jgi:signal transduction histidine kinase
MSGSNSRQENKSKPSFPVRVLVTALLTAGLMTIYEATKQWVYPGITIWQSHAVTIIFSTTIATVAMFVALRRYELLRIQNEEEIAERKQAQEDLAQAKKVADEANKQKDFFLAMLSHELRNPLAPIRISAGLMKQMGPLDPALVRLLNMIDRQVGHMTRLIDDLLDVSRIAHHKITLRKDEVDLSQLVKTVIEDHRLRLEANSVQLEFHAPNKSIWVYADAARLSQVMDNLLSNANKFTDRNGQVTVNLEATDNGEALVSVTDTGIGMDARTMNHIFEPFSQADRSIERSHGGLGLGLTLSHGLIEQHGGKMRAESAGPGCGSRFMFTLPQIVPTNPPAIPAGPTRAARTQRVLLIEDNLDTAEALKMLLELSGHIVTIAHSGNEGIEQARRLRPQVVVCDIGLPGANGYDVARALRSDPETHSTYMIAMTGYGQDEDKRMAITAGFDQHLTKPIAIDALEHLLTRG